MHLSVSVLIIINQLKLVFFEHYKVIANSTNLPIIIYNVPGRTSSNILSNKDFKKKYNLIYFHIKYCIKYKLMNIILKKYSYLVISGDDALTLPHICVGGDGVISVIANAFPKRFSTMVHAALNNNLSFSAQDRTENIRICLKMGIQPV